MSPREGEQALHVLRSRDGSRSDVPLMSGRVCHVWNVAWGRDLGDDFDHVTSNISPSIAGSDADLFFTSEIETIEDEWGNVLFSRGAE